jgi:alanine dehydrogenase
VHCRGAGRVSAARVGAGHLGQPAGRTNDDQIIVFDSTGTALQDVAAAAAFYRRAVQKAECPRFAFNA